MKDGVSNTSANRQSDDQYRRNPAHSPHLPSQRIKLLESQIAVAPRFSTNPASTTKGLAKNGQG